MTECDATLCTDDGGNAGRVQVIVSVGDRTESRSTTIPAHCSDNPVKVWHGMDTPAYACGFHWTYFKVAVFRGHRNRVSV